eukprot:GHVT01076307.1.p1 GENE.GHVT01076307.1~~GHVT01076307.1.p1  ORF type:complete len:224 (+),score=16.18 GHVT01076307.1:178-849(+)
MLLLSVGSSCPTTTINTGVVPTSVSSYADYKYSNYSSNDNGSFFYDYSSSAACFDSYCSAAVRYCLVVGYFVRIQFLFFFLLLHTFWPCLGQLSLPTVLRAMTLNMGMLATFDHAKEALKDRLGDGPSCLVSSAALSGLAAVTLSLPFDFIKTRIQRMKADPVTGKVPYSGVVDCIRKVWRAEGPAVFYSGYPTYYFRIAPHAMITLLVVDALNKQIKSKYNQ